MKNTKIIKLTYNFQKKYYLEIRNRDKLFFSEKLEYL